MRDAWDSPPPRPTAGRIFGIDGLRGVSILLVLAGHGAATVPVPDGRMPAAAAYLFNASLGVLTFFVISGYLITRLLRSEREQTGAIRLRAFYARRVLRIFPALYAYLLAVGLLRAAGWIDTTWGDLAVAGTFLTNYKHVFSVPTNGDYWFVGHFWTLSLEEQFYLFWPVTILAVGLCRAPRVALFIALTAPVVRVASYFAWPAARGQLGMMLHTSADPIMIGCLAALWEDRPGFEWLLRRGSHWVWPVAAALFLFVGSRWLALRFRGEYQMTAGQTLNGLAVAFVLLWVARHPTSLIGRLMNAPVLRGIGILSYSLYLWQQLFLTTKNHTWTGLFPVNFLVCFAAAAVSYQMIEGPFLRLRSRFRWRPGGKAGESVGARPVAPARPAGTLRG